MIWYNVYIMASITTEATATFRDNTGNKDVDRNTGLRNKALAGLMGIAALGAAFGIGANTGGGGNNETPVAAVDSTFENDQTQDNTVPRTDNNTIQTPTTVQPENDPAFSGEGKKMNNFGGRTVTREISTEFTERVKDSRIYYLDNLYVYSDNSKTLLENPAIVVVTKESETNYEIDYSYNGEPLEANQEMWFVAPTNHELNEVVILDPHIITHAGWIDSSRSGNFTQYSSWLGSNDTEARYSSGGKIVASKGTIREDADEASRIETATSGLTISDIYATITQ